MKQDVILVLDCGATNVRAIAVDRQGKIVARAATPNASDIATENSAWHPMVAGRPFCNASPTVVSASVHNWPSAMSAGSPSPLLA
ncbi:L-fuculokinase [Citrobacter freundii]|nr:L-fuculokinase [Citrobacter freundii]